MKQQYMHFETGSIDSLDGWIEEIAKDPQELLESDFDTASELMHHYIESRVFIAVEYIGGEWVEIT